MNTENDTRHAATLMCLAAMFLMLFAIAFEVGANPFLIAMLTVGFFVWFAVAMISG